MTTPRKKKPGLIPTLLEALHQRYHRVIQVIDEALDSENLKDKIWAVEQILKRSQPDEAAKAAQKGKKPAVPPQQLSDADLLGQLRELLHEEKTATNADD